MAFSRLRIVCRLWRTQRHRTPVGETVSPRWRSYMGHAPLSPRGLLSGQRHHGLFDLPEPRFFRGGVYREISRSAA